MNGIPKRVDWPFEAAELQTTFDRRLEVSRHQPISKPTPPKPRHTGSLPISAARLRPSTKTRHWKAEDFYSDKSRIVFCSSFRRMMQKAQVFSLESNTSVRNRLTHSLEVADIGRTIARHVGKKLEKQGIATTEETECIQSIVENACLMHDIGNPPFGHFGEAAIKNWFKEHGSKQFAAVEEPGLKLSEHPKLHDFFEFDGNPQSFRIVTHLHCDVDYFGLNLTSSTLLTSIKYPNSVFVRSRPAFAKKLGIFATESGPYQQICQACGVSPGQRYFLAYLMELADDICYCLSDIADAFEKGLFSSRDFKEEFRDICDERAVNVETIIPKGMEKIENFGFDVSIKVATRIIEEASDQFAANIDRYLDGSANELSKDIESGEILECFKVFARRHLYTNHEVQRNEIAGSRVVDGLLRCFGRLLYVPRADFQYFVERNELRKGSGLDIQWRIFNQLSKRMLKVYKHCTTTCTDEEEWICRSRLIVDYISGLTDNSALQLYQNFMGISLLTSW